jgi:hypothetical protein
MAMGMSLDPSPVGNAISSRENLRVLAITVQFRRER